MNIFTQLLITLLIISNSQMFGMFGFGHDFRSKSLSPIHQTHIETTIPTSIPSVTIPQATQQPPVIKQQLSTTHNTAPFHTNQNTQGIFGMKQLTEKKIPFKQQSNIALARTLSATTLDVKPLTEKNVFPTTQSNNNINKKRSFSMPTCYPVTQ
jgi:hypothetical protein